MAIYIDTYEAAKGKYIFSHMVFENIFELIEFAESLGINNKNLQKPPKSSWFHYDISKGKKKIALERGAVLVSSKRILQILKENYKR